MMRYFNLKCKTKGNWERAEFRNSHELFRKTRKSVLGLFPWHPFPMDAYFNQQHNKITRRMSRLSISVSGLKSMKSSPLFKVIFTLVRGNAWKAGTYGNMDVDKQDKMDDRQHPSIDLHVLSPWDMSRTTTGCFLRWKPSWQTCSQTAEFCS